MLTPVGGWHATTEGREQRGPSNGAVDPRHPFLNERAYGFKVMDFSEPDVLTGTVGDRRTLKGTIKRFRFGVRLPAEDEETCRIAFSSIELLR